MQLPKTRKIESEEVLYAEHHRGFRIQYGAAQTVGKRQEQQDCFLVREFPGKSSFLAVVADGMGGLESGAGASGLAADILAAEAEQRLKEDMTPEQISELLLHITEKTGKELVAWCKRQQVTAGSTLAAVLVYRKKLFFCAVGDSRIYLCRNGELFQINEDHSLENYLLRYHLRQEEVPKLHGSLYSYLGQDPVREIEYSRKGMPLLPGDMLVLCSDGVYQAVSERELLTVLSEKNIQKQAEELVKKVLEKKMEQQDNATLIILRCSDN